MSLPDNCVEFRCSLAGKTTELVVIDDCSCCKPVTEPATTTTDPPEITTTPAPKPTTKPAPKPTTKPAPKPTTDGSGGSRSDCDYSAEKFSSSHSMNLPKKEECGKFHKSNVTAAEQQIILAKHNELRAMVANGLETRGTPGPQPGATNMRELTWNIQLAEVAQAWAQQCNRGHDSYDDRKICDPDYTVGQNIYYGWSFEPANALEKAIQHWYDEVEDMPNTYVDSFTSAGAPGVIGHYTQVVWADTYEVGCGAIHYPATHGTTTYPQSKIYVCNYGKAGNWKNQAVYESGDAASNCPAGTADSVAYPGLCA